MRPPSGGYLLETCDAWTGSFLPSHLATLEEQAAEATTAECHLKRAFDFSILHWPSWITAHGQSKLRN